MPTDHDKLWLLEEEECACDVVRVILLGCWLCSQPTCEEVREVKERRLSDQLAGGRANW